MAAAKADRGFLVHQDQESITYRRTVGVRIMCGLLAALFLPVALLMATVTWFITVGASKPEFGIGLLILGVAIMFAFLTAFMLTLAGPCEIRFDLKNRTYRFLRGLPLLAKAVEGPFTDFDYLYIRSIDIRSYGTWSNDSRIYLIWKRAPKLYGFVPQPELLVQMLSKPDLAYQQAKDLAGLLQLPLEEGKRKAGAPVAATPPAPRSALAGSSTAPQSASTEPPAPPSTQGQVGRVAHVEGPLVDVQFDPLRMPSVYNAVTIKDPLFGLSVTAIVAQYLPGGIARCVLLTSESRLANGLEAIDSGGPDPRSPSVEVLLQAVAAIGRDRIAGPTLLETGIKAIDLLCPIPSGGKAGIFADWGVGALVLVPEMVQVMEARSGGWSLFTLLHLQTDAKNWHASMAELPQRSGEKQTVYLPIETPDDAASSARFTMLDSTLHLSRRLAKQGLYPPIDPQMSRSRLLEEARVGRDHLETANAVRQILQRYEAFQPTLESTGIDALSPSDRIWVSRARKIERFLSQPFHVAEPYTGIPGKSVPLTETLRSCKSILEGAHDDRPEQAFYMIGGIDEAAARFN